MKLAVIFLYFGQICLVFTHRECNKDNPCIRFCCSDCHNDTDISDQPGADKIKNKISNIFGNPCESMQMYMLQPEDYTYDEWTLTDVSLFSNFCGLSSIFNPM